MRLSATKAMLAPSSARTSRRNAPRGGSPEKASHQRYPAAAKDAPSSTSPAIMGTAASSKSIPARSKMEALVVQASRNGSTTAPGSAVGSRKARCPEGPPAALRHGQAPREAPEAALRRTTVSAVSDKRCPPPARGTARPTAACTAPARNSSQGRFPPPAVSRNRMSRAPPFSLDYRRSPRLVPIVLTGRCWKYFRNYLHRVDALNWASVLPCPHPRRERPPGPLAKAATSRSERTDPGGVGWGGKTERKRAEGEKGRLA